MFESTLGCVDCDDKDPNFLASHREPSWLCVVCVEAVSLMSFAIRGCRPGRHALITERV